MQITHAAPFDCWRNASHRHADTHAKHPSQHVSIVGNVDPGLLLLLLFCNEKRYRNKHFQSFSFSNPHDVKLLCLTWQTVTGAESHASRNANSHL